MAPNIRTDLVGVVHVRNDSDSVLVLKAGDHVPKGYTVGDHLIAPDTAGSAVVIPEGAPAGDWKVDQLKAYAERESIDLGTATKKDEIVAVLVPAND